MSMSYDELVVKYGGLDEMANTVILKAKALEDIMHQLKSDVGAVGSGWDGEAYRTFHDVQKKWQTDTDAVKGALQEISNMIRHAAERYHHGDLKAASYYQL